MDAKRSPFPLRDWFGQLQTYHKLHGDAGVMAFLQQGDNLRQMIGILAVASEMEITPEWQATRMRMWSQAKHDQQFAARDLASRAAQRYED